MDSSGSGKIPEMSGSWIRRWRICECPAGQAISREAIEKENQMLAAYFKTHPELEHAEEAG